MHRVAWCLSPLPKELPQARQDARGLSVFAKLLVDVQRNLGDPVRKSRQAMASRAQFVNQRA